MPALLASVPVVPSDLRVLFGGCGVCTSSVHAFTEFDVSHSNNLSAFMCPKYLGTLTKNIS